MSRKLAILTTLATLAAAQICGCSSQQPLQPLPAVSNESAPVIVKVTSRDSTITVRAAASGPVYSVQDRNGQQVVPAMSFQQLQAAEPQLARHVETMQASGSPWAGID